QHFFHYLQLFTMAYSPLPALDNLTTREWHNLTSTTEQCIEFCQRVGLLHVYPTEPCKKCTIIGI
ncbi:unnamed protein product, partial [Rotaria sp. Silwood1]